jgi:hypothetical protein
MLIIFTETKTKSNIPFLMSRCIPRAKKNLGGVSQIQISEIVLICANYNDLILGFSIL